ncbi:MAG: Trk system potassium transporter TrkA [Oscillospiraceae bacterium]|nr:Trk system potassium transporter TrkA [Oscillospiraceae bacterium]MDE7171588.1 Trk system potassium transporter TrkA [Oscillospiraceae bacterium]
MTIIIAGGGKVGSTLAEHLAGEGHSVTIVDVSDSTLSRLSNQLDVMCLKGNCVSRDVLLEAGAKDTDVLIAATGSDEINLLCCHCANRIGVANTVARVRGAEYVNDLDTLKGDLGITMLINPELTAAVEISRLLRFPSAANIDSFARGRVELMSFTVQEGDFLVGRSLASLSSKIQGLPMLLCAVERGDEVFIPNGASVLAQGDRVSVAGTPNGIHQFFKLLGRQTHRIRNVFIIGGGRIAFYLLVQLERLGMSCKVVERSDKRCRELAEEFPHSLIIHGDGTDPELLTEERMAASDAFIALTDRDEDNLIISLYAHQAGVSKVVAKSSRQNYTAIARSAGVESVVSPKLATAGLILRFIRGLQNSKGTVMNALYRIAGGKAEAMEFRASSATRNLKVPLKELKLRPGVLIAVIVRGKKVIIPEGSTCLEEGDNVIVIARDSGILDLNDIYEGAGL